MFFCCAASATETEVVIPTGKTTATQQDDKPLEEEKAAPPPAPAPEPAKAPAVEEKPPEPVKASEPAGAVSEFTVKLSKGGKVLGIDIAYGGDDMTVVWVDAVADGGAAAIYNDSVGADKKIAPGDYIVKANSVSGKGILECLKGDADLEITFKKSTEVNLSIVKNGKIGLDLVYQAEKEYLYVKGIQSEGAVKSHNETASVDQKFKVPSRIVGVDGFRGKAPDLLKKLQASGATIELVVVQMIA